MLMQSVFFHSEQILRLNQNSLRKSVTVLNPQNLIYSPSASRSRDEFFLPLNVSPLITRLIEGLRMKNSTKPSACVAKSHFEITPILK